MTNSAIQHQKGITIVEIMVAISLSIIILAGVMHIFINNKQTYRVQEAFARLQENGRFAMHFITKDLRMAGFMGCAGKMVGTPENSANYYPHPKTGPDNTPDDVGEFNESGIEGFEYSSLPIVLTETDSLIATNVYPGPDGNGTDLIRIKRASSTGVRVYETPAPGSGQIKLGLPEANGMFQQYDTLFVSDCKQADIFVATGASVTPNPTPGYVTISMASAANLDPHLANDYGTDAEVYKLINRIYYIGTNTAGEPALFRQSLGNANTMVHEELVEGIENMQLLYGEDTDDDGTANHYKDAAAIGDWDSVVSVRIELEVRSVEDNVAAEKNPNPYNDRRLRRTFTTSIALRNQV